MNFKHIITDYTNYIILDMIFTELTTKERGYSDDIIKEWIDFIE